MKAEDIKKVYYTNKDNQMILYFEDANGNIEKSVFDPEVHAALIDEFIKNNGMSIDDPEFDKKLEDAGIMIDLAADDPLVQDLEDKAFLLDTDFDDLSQLGNVDNDADLTKDKKGKVKKIIAAASALGITGTALAVGISSCVANQSDKEDTTSIGVDGTIDFNSASFEELMKSLPSGSQRSDFFQKVYDITGKLNTIALDKTVFALESDTFVNSDGKEETAKLQFTFDEIMAAKIVLNNYTGEDLKAIFGMQELNSQEIMSNYQRFATKMSIFAMNGKAQSGISMLIEDEANRTWFEKIEGNIVGFNKEANNENADKTIRTFAYFYQHGINGIDNLSNDEASLNGVKNLALHMMRGYYDANVQDDYEQYLVVSSNPSSFDSQYRSNVAAQVQKGETLKFYLDEAEKGPCTLSAVSDHIDSIVDKLATEQTEQKSFERLLQQKLAEALLEKGNTALASRVMNEAMTDELYKAVEASVPNELKAYNDAMDALNESIPSFEQIKNAADKELGPYQEVKDDVLYNNRVRGTNKTLDNIGTGLSEQEWNNMSREEQEEYAKENGTIQSTTTTTTETEVSKDDLTPSEKEEAEKQEQIIIAKEEANYEGQEDAHIYSSEAGAYSHAPIINKVNPNAPSEVTHNGSLFSTAVAAKAFNDETITASDSQIQARFQKDLANFKAEHNVTDQEIIDAYKAGWLNIINQKLETAVKEGLILRSEAERLYKEALDAANSKNDNVVDSNKDNNANDTTLEEEAPIISEEDFDKYPIVDEDDFIADPNVNPGIGSSDEGFEDVFDESFGSENTYTSYSYDPYVGNYEEFVENDAYLNQAVEEGPSLKK